MAHRPKLLTWSWLVALSLSSCLTPGPAALPSPGSTPSILPGTPASATEPALTLQFPSRNGAVALPASLGSDAMTARFPGDDKEIAVAAVTGATSRTLSKPLDAPADGQIVFSRAGREIALAKYVTASDLIDIEIDTQQATFPFRVAPAESTVATGNRSIRTAANSTLSLMLPDGNLRLGDVSVDADGLVGSLPGIVKGSKAGLQLQVQPIQLNLQDVVAPVRLIPFETEFVPGNRLLRIISGIPMALAVGVNSVQIDGINVGADGTVSEAKGLIRNLKGVIEPVTRSVRFDAGDYAGMWRLRRYESGFAVGSRSITTVAGDRLLTVNFGNFDNESPAFDPSAPSGAVKSAGTALRFNLVSVPVDPGNLAAAYRVDPFETAFGTGRRNVTMPRLAATGTISLVSGADTAGTFQLDTEGSITTRSPGLIVSGSNLNLSTLGVRIDPGGSPRPFRVMPFEEAPLAGARTVTMVRGQPGRIESNGETLAFQIDGDGSIRAQDSRLTVSGSTITVAWPN